MYIFNDIADADLDAKHPQKKYRPIPAGRIDKHMAAGSATIIIIIALVLSGLVSLAFFALVLGYIVLTLAYSFYLKNVAIADIFCIAVGFLLRLEAGGRAFDVVISPWLFITVFLLSLFLALGKRRAELGMLGCNGKEHRPSLHKYPRHFLKGAMVMTGAAVLVTYSMYVVHRPYLIYTVPLCCYGLFRYLLLVREKRIGDPTEVILRDWQLFVISLIWGVTVLAVIYGR